VRWCDGSQRLAVAGRDAMETTVKYAFGEEFGVGAGLHNFPGLHDEDPIGYAQRRSPVRDKDNSFPFSEFFDCIQDFTLRFRIDSRRRFVEN
jgi:hypothetical protein